MPVPAALAYALTFGVYGKYVLICIAMPIGGPFLIFASGFLLHLHLLDIVPLFIAIAFGELAMDTVWYYVGRSFTDTAVARYGSYVGLTPDLFSKVKALFVRYDATVLFVSKILMGLGMGIVLLVIAGASRMSFWKYLLYNTLGEIVWVSMMLYIGYFYAGLYDAVASSLRIVFLGGTAIVLIAVVYGGSRYLRAKALERF